MNSSKVFFEEARILREEDPLEVKTLLGENLPALLLKWYDQSRRTFPWRAQSAEIPNPYHVWLSEIMLQQTTTVTVIPYFRRFLQKWPTLNDFAEASLDDILHQWQGLGYYARARNLHKCAQVVVLEYGGHFPQTEEELLTLPGIGPYTAAAIAAIAFGRSATPIDGNIKRVISRLYGIDQPPEKALPFIQARAETLTPQTDRPGDYAQALMDLGATVCTPKNPKCLLCPWQRACAAREKGLETQLPRRKQKVPLPQKYGFVLCLRNQSGDYLMHRRPEKGLLGGMVSFPTGPWLTEHWDVQCLSELTHRFTGAVDWDETDHIVQHTFTHFHLRLKILKGTIPRDVSLTWKDEGFWVAPLDFKNYALPTLIQKVCSKIL